MLRCGPVAPRRSTAKGIFEEEPGIVIIPVVEELSDVIVELTEVCSEA